ncbi:hypothetical protein PtrSN002B_004269 [Pyrenophora tritici-repentis]|nr:hypothetical protein Ptr86124_005522 [Pyrenophora tritici-repentis]KAI1554051.1 hypothetical protein PtrSN002B_004269 [Pyrenophora tritici-repentis]KAI1577868.1 hypothetical protein PtrEW4_001402 [Pyrenophora tritici-repentis]KAI1589077.1 hypothetical protein PtrEW7m1_000103 [Pyrenophora tritici-repentis]KAI1664403.1 hypothetical protein L13192_11587 [Pyrenophora tritici-repentis]
MPKTWPGQLQLGLHPPLVRSSSPSPSASEFPLPPESTSDIAERNASQTTVPIPPMSPRHASLRFSQTPLFEPPRSEYGDSMSDAWGLLETEEPVDTEFKGTDNPEPDDPHEDDNIDPERDDNESIDSKYGERVVSELDYVQADILEYIEREYLEQVDKEEDVLEDNNDKVQKDTGREDSFRKDITV